LVQARALGVKSPLHAARHTFASFAIASGMNAKTVCMIMGHADIATTYDLYGHLLPGSEDEAASRLDAYFEQVGAPQSRHSRSPNGAVLSGPPAVESP
jgi:integrase